MAGSTNHTAYRGLERRPNGNTKDAVCAVVVMVRVLVTVLELGVTEAGLKSHPARAGSPLHEKLIGLVNEPWGVTVSVNVPDCPAVTVVLVGVDVNVKLAAFTAIACAAGLAAYFSTLLALRTEEMNILVDRIRARRR